MNSSKDELGRQLKKIISSKEMSGLINSDTRFRVFDPLTTLHCYIYQIVKSCSCRSTLVYLNSKRKLNNQKPINVCSSAFSRAKRKLSLAVLLNILKSSGSKVSKMGAHWSRYFYL